MQVQPSNAFDSPKIAAARKADKRNRGELSGIHINPAENGYSVRCSFEPAKYSPKGNTIYPDDEVTVYTTAADAAKYVAEMLSRHEKYESTEE